MGIRLGFHHHAPEQAAALLAFHQQAANQLRSNNFCGAAEEGLGQGWEILGPWRRFDGWTAAELMPILMPDPQSGSSPWNVCRCWWHRSPRMQSDLHHRATKGVMSRTRARQHQPTNGAHKAGALTSPERSSTLHINRRRLPELPLIRVPSDVPAQIGLSKNPFALKKLFYGS